jgi:hypothetical protein
MRRPISETDFMEEAIECHTVVIDNLDKTLVGKSRTTVENHENTVIETSQFVLNDAVHLIAP